MDFKLKDKVVVVTGGSQGIGKAVAEAYAAEGAKIAICARTLSKLEATAKEFEAKGYEVYFESVDVASEESVETFAKNVFEHFGRIDVWVNNAARFESKSILEHTLDNWHDVMRTNLDSVFLGTRAAARYMKQTGGGAIINTSSYASVIPACYRCSYATSKYAVNGFTRCAAGELSPFGIRVNAVAVGSINTEMQKAAKRTPEDLEKLAEGFALHRMGEPEEMGTVYLFLGSEMSSFVTGITLEASGGKILVQNCNQAWTERR